MLALPASGSPANLIMRGHRDRVFAENGLDAWLVSSNPHRPDKLYPPAWRTQEIYSSVGHYTRGQPGALEMMTESRRPRAPPRLP